MKRRKKHVCHCRPKKRKLVKVNVLEASEPSSHLGSQLPLPLVGAVRGRTAGRTVAEDGALGQIADVAALVQSVLSRLQSGLQLLPQQQVVPGLLHLKTPTRYTSSGCGPE